MIVREKLAVDSNTPIVVHSLLEKTKYIEEHYGSQHLDWKLINQKLELTSDKSIDKVILENKEGVQTLLFDISSFIYPVGR